MKPTTPVTRPQPRAGRKQRSSRLAAAIKGYQLYLLFLPTLLYVLVFLYGPMYGVLIAFKSFRPHLGILGSPWVGFRHFVRFFNMPTFWTIIGNTIGLSLYHLAAGFPIPILLAIGLNISRNRKFKKTVQTITYAPHFISTVVMVGMLSVFLSPRYGLVNHAIAFLGGERIFFLGEPEMFQSLYVWSGVWQDAGWGTIIYLAALSGIDTSLHEAAIVDGATLRQRVWHIDLPGILPTIVILLVLNLGRVMSVGFEKAYLMQNALNIDRSEIIATYVYKVGLLDAQYSFSASVGLFNSAVNFVLLLTVNRIAKLLGQGGLW
jgi:putative aldouronate transport system permease protein